MRLGFYYPSRISPAHCRATSNINPRKMVPRGRIELPRPLGARDFKGARLQETLAFYNYLARLGTLCPVGAPGWTRTITALRPCDFKSHAYAIPPRGLTAL